MFFCNLVPLKYLNLSWRLKELNYLEMTGFSGRPGVTVADLFQDFCYKNYQKCHNIDLIKACLYLFYFYLTNSNAELQTFKSILKVTPFWSSLTAVFIVGR